MKLLGGDEIGDIEGRHVAAVNTMRRGRGLSSVETRDLIEDLDALLADHHELRLRLTRARLAMDGRQHGADPGDSVVAT